MPCTPQHVASAIRSYCAAHPQARDTIDGISWWVQMQLQDEFRSCVAEAVQLLTAEGTLERHLLEDGSEVFGCKASAAVRNPGDSSN